MRRFKLDDKVYKCYGFGVNAAWFEAFILEPFHGKTTALALVHGVETEIGDIYLPEYRTTPDVRDLMPPIGAVWLD